MPLYEYHCTACGESTELLQKHSDDPATTCPHCHKDNLVKQISSTSFQLKGNGWYVTDFKNKKENKSTPEKTETTESKEATKTEATKSPEKTAEKEKSGTDQ